MSSRWLSLSLIAVFSVACGSSPSAPETAPWAGDAAPTKTADAGDASTTDAPSQDSGEGGANPPSSGRIKWNPGHYAGGNGWLEAGEQASSWFISTDLAFTNFPDIVGYRLWINWSTVEENEGVYDFSQVDAIFDRLKTHYGKPRRLVLTLYPSGGGCGVVPRYIQQDKSYGPSPAPGVYGLWAVHIGDKLTGACEPALWRPAVMNRYIALIQALGAHYDGDPYFEALMFQEDIFGGPGTIAADSDYTSAAMTTQIEAMMTAATTAFAHSSVVMENTWGPGGPTGAQDLEEWMVEHRVAPGTADTLGQSAFANHPWGSVASWGVAAYLGVVVGGSAYAGGDLRPKSRAMLDIEADDIAGPYYRHMGGPFTPQDVCAALVSTYKASHAFWDVMFGTESIRGEPVPASAKWTNLAPVLSTKACQLDPTYPPNYPGH